MKLYEILELISFVLAIVGLVLKIISQKTQNKKLIKASEIVDEMQELCKEAERLEANGQGKKEYVLMGIEWLCKKQKLNYDEPYWSNKIDEFIASTKQINFKSKEE